MTVSFWRLVPGCWRMGQGNRGTKYEEIPVCGCGHINPDPLFVGIQEGLEGEPALALWNCRECGSTRAIKWADLTDRQRAAVQDVEDALRPRSPEMMPGRG